MTVIPMPRQIIAAALGLLIGVPLGAWLVFRFIPKPDPVITVELAEIQEDVALSQLKSKGHRQVFAESNDAFH